MKTGFINLLFAVLLAQFSGACSMQPVPESYHRNEQPFVAFDNEVGNAVIKGRVAEAEFFDEWRGEWRGSPFWGSVATVILKDVEVQGGDFEIPDQIELGLVTSDVENIVVGQNIYVVVYVFEQASVAPGIKPLTNYNALYWGYPGLGMCVPVNSRLSADINSAFNAEGESGYECMSNH